MCSQLVLASDLVLVKRLLKNKSLVLVLVSQLKWKRVTKTHLVLDNHIVCFFGEKSISSFFPPLKF